MAFCINCGQELANGAKFCANCGTAVNGTGSNTQRKTTYDGEIHKCPNCGEILDSFISSCPSCGYELRGATPTSAIKELSRKLEQIEKEREIEPPAKSIIGKLYGTEGKVSKTDEQKINLIRSFPIPNTKEDVLEFMILASSNINFKLYGLGDRGIITASQREVSDAWFAKMEQVNEKAQIIFMNQPELFQINAIYEKTNKKLKKKKWEVPLLVAGCILGPLLFVGLIWLLVFLTDSI